MMVLTTRNTEPISKALQSTVISAGTKNSNSEICQYSYNKSQRHICLLFLHYKTLTQKKIPIKIIWLISRHTKFICELISVNLTWNWMANIQHSAKRTISRTRTIILDKCCAGTSETQRKYSSVLQNLQKNLVESI